MKKISLKRAKSNYTDPHKPRYVGFDLSDLSLLSRKTIRVVSYNIKFSQKIPHAIRILRKHEKLHRADIICLQEMTLEGVQEIANTLRYNYVYYPASVHPKIKNDFGNAIFSKWPVIDDKKFILPQIRTKALQRIAVEATLKINDKLIRVYSVHMDVFLGPNSRQNQMIKLVESIPKHIRHCIVAGDFNTFTKAQRVAVVDPFLQEDFLVATEKIGWTFKHWFLLNKKTSLDHILTKGLSIINSGKINDRTASDHLPIWVELQMPK